MTIGQLTVRISESVSLDHVIKGPDGYYVNGQKVRKRSVTRYIEKVFEIEPASILQTEPNDEDGEEKSYLPRKIIELMVKNCAEKVEVKDANGFTFEKGYEVVIREFSIENDDYIRVKDRYVGRIQLCRYTPMRNRQSKKNKNL
ncbi:hypothetical protein HYV50_02030 [Candidatus Pacearchaeota archaeon]|nr:hypothetical protein [Candidatus Pacearchaeota archaeon]